MRHAAKIETSDRLQGVLAILKDRAWHGSFELMRQTNLVAIGSAISEIRANGYEVESRCVGQGRYEYRLLERVEEEYKEPPRVELHWSTGSYGLNPPLHRILRTGLRGKGVQRLGVQKILFALAWTALIPLPRLNGTTGVI